MSLALSWALLSYWSEYVPMVKPESLTVDMFMVVLSGQKRGVVQGQS